MKLKANLIVAALAMPGVVFASAPAVKTSGHGAANTAAVVQQATHWTYSGSEGPSNWGDLDGNFTECKAGKRQSPINIKTEKARKNNLYVLETMYRPVMLNVKNNGHTLQVNYNTKNNSETVKFSGEEHVIEMPAEYRSTLNIGGSEYKLMQFHFHSPSEHAKDGRRYPLEVHFVHQNKNKNLSVIGVFFEEGPANPDFQAILNSAPQSVGTNDVDGALINASDLLPSSRNYMHYTGSLTTPPCSENVNWFVMKKPLKVSSSQVREFINIVGKNARPLQNMNWRTLFQSK